MNRRFGAKMPMGGVRPPALQRAHCRKGALHTHQLSPEPQYLSPRRYMGAVPLPALRPVRAVR